MYQGHRDFNQSNIKYLKPAFVLGIECFWLRFQVKLDAHRRKFLFSAYPTSESTKAAAAAFHTKATDMLAKFDAFKGKVAILDINHGYFFWQDQLTVSIVSASQRNWLNGSRPLWVCSDDDVLCDGFPRYFVLVLLIDAIQCIYTCICIYIHLRLIRNAYAHTHIYIYKSLSLCKTLYIYIYTSTGACIHCTALRRKNAMLGCTLIASLCPAH